MVDENRWFLAGGVLLGLGAVRVWMPPGWDVVYLGVWMTILTVIVIPRWLDDDVPRQ